MLLFFRVHIDEQLSHLQAACHLIDGSGNCRSLNPSATIRTVYVADTLPNMSPLDIPYASTLSRRRARKKRLPGLGRHNSDVDHHVNTSLPIVQHAFYSCLGPRPSAPVEYLPGFFGHPSTSATSTSPPPRAPVDERHK